jgi:hypothetical protein
MPETSADVRQPYNCSDSSYASACHSEGNHNLPPFAQASWAQYRSRLEHAASEASDRLG